MNTNLMIDGLSVAFAKRIIDYNKGSLLINIKDYSLSKGYDMSLEQLEEIINYKDASVYVNLDRLYHPSDIINLKTFIQKLVDLGVKGIIAADLALPSILDDMNVKLELINGNMNLNTNYVTMNAMKDHYDGYFVSNEISVKEIIRILENNGSSLMMQVFGKQRMFYSKRMLLSSYYEYNNKKVIDFSPISRLLIKDNGVDENYSYIYEDSVGTYIYTDYDVCGLKYIKDLQTKKLKYFYLNGLFQDEICYEKIIDIYYDYLEDKINLDEALSQVSQYSPNISDSFYNDKTIVTIEQVRELEEETKNV